MKEIALIIGGTLKNKELLNLKETSMFEEVPIHEAGQLAMELEAKGKIKIFISTVGTASYIEKFVNIPVIKAYNTYYDLLENIKFFEETYGVVNQPLALIIHSSGYIYPDRIQPFIKNQLSIFYFDDEEDIRKLVESLGKRNFQWFIGGPTTQGYIRKMGLNCHLLCLGTETIQNTIDKAKSVLEYSRKERNQRQELQTILNLFPDAIVATDQEGIITVCNNRAIELLGVTGREIIGKNIEQVTLDPSWVNTYKKGVKWVDELREYKKTKLFTTRQPILNEGTIIGAVGTFQEAAKIEQLEHKYRKLQTLGLTAKYNFSNIIGESILMKKTVEKAKAYARVDSTVLIEGETGTGKEIFAQSIHNYSPRKNGPFVAVNCAALPENLLESEIMGYEEGAFTGAKKGGKSGLFELAHNGTIFLDEINQMPLMLQARVLRVIQEKQVLRLGGERVIPVDVRIIAATNEDLNKLVQEKLFRDDLYYRLNVLNLSLPPLRERVDDIPLLIKYYFELFSNKYDAANAFTGTTTNLLMSYSWPGNVRELANLCERYIVINQQQFVSDVSYVKEYIDKRKDDKNDQNKAYDKDSINVRLNTLEDMEQQLIQQVLKRMKGNKVQSAMLLGLSRTTLWKKLKEKNNLIG